MTSFFGELRRRNVVKVAVAYAIVGWLLVEITSTVLPTFEAPQWVLQTITFVVILGFPLALILSWAFDLTAEGLVRDKGTNVAAPGSGRRIEYIFTGLLVVAVATLLYREFSPSEPAVEVVTEEAQGEVLPNSVAVLPFEDLSLDPEYAFFAPGIHDTILNELAKISDLNVIARTSMERYADTDMSIKEIAEELNVETVMEGSVQYAEGRVLVTAQLIDPETNTHLWSDNYNREFAGIFEIQADIATQIAMALEVELLPSELASIESRPTDSTEAYEHYLQAMSLPPFAVFPNVFAVYMESLDRAIAADPEFGDAYAQRAIGYARQGDDSGALDDARRALELDPTIGTAYAAQALVYQPYYDRQGEARAAYERAVELSPNDPEILIEYGRFLRGSEEYAEAIRLGNQAIALDPEDFAHRDRMGMIYMSAGDFPAAARQLRQGIEVNPAAGSAYMLLAQAEFASGNTAAARENLNRAAQIWQPTPYWGVAFMAYLYGRLGEPDQASRLLARLDDSTPDPPARDRSYRAFATLGTGDRAGALREWNDLVDSYLEEGLPVSANFYRFKTNWLLDPILDQPEFVEVRSRLGFRE